MMFATDITFEFCQCYRGIERFCSELSSDKRQINICKTTTEMKHIYD